MMLRDFYLAKNTLIRKEHFGTLILLRNGQRYLVNNVYFDILKCIYNQTKIGIRDEKVKNFLRGLLAKNIITKDKRKTGNVKLLANKFISFDCLSFPRTVYWECTERCNYKCIHCYTSSGLKNSYTGLPFGIVKKLINEMDRYGTEFFSIGGGEPLLYPHLFKVLEYANNKGLTIEMTTNASLITRETIKKLIKSGLKFIQVSLDGATEKTYLNIRKGGNFRKVVKILPVLAQYFTLSVCVVINKLNYTEINSLIRLAKKVGAKHFRVIPLMEIGRGADMESLQLSKKEFRNLHKFIYNQRKKERSINIQLNENLVIPQTKNIFWMPKNHFGCSAGRTICSIDAHGNVYPCSFLSFKELACGNIKNKTLMKIWKDSSIMNEFRNLEKVEGKCAYCRYLDLCRGGCRAAAYLKNKKINNSDYLCSIV